MAGYLDRFQSAVRLDPQDELDLVPYIGSIVALDAPQFTGAFRLEAFGIDAATSNIFLYGQGLRTPLEMLSHQKLYVNYQPGK